MSTPRRQASDRPPKEEHYKIVVVGAQPPDLSDRVSTLHAEAVFRRIREPQANEPAGLGA